MLQPTEPHWPGLLFLFRHLIWSHRTWWKPFFSLFPPQFLPITHLVSQGSMGHRKEYSRSLGDLGARRGSAFNSLTLDKPSKLPRLSFFFLWSRTIGLDISKGLSSCKIVDWGWLLFHSILLREAFALLQSPNPMP